MEEITPHITGIHSLTYDPNKEREEIEGGLGGGEGELGNGGDEQEIKGD